MSQEKDVEMGGEGGAASQNKSQSSVVDDFLAALFASHPPPVEDNDPKPLPNDDPIQQGAGVKRERTPDEFDEYEMLSKRKHNAQKQEDSTITSTTATATAASSNVRHQTTAPSGREQDLAPEARMLIRNLPYAVRKRDVLAHFSKYGHIHDCYLKNTSGYIQFANPESCVAAVQAENGKMFRGGIIGRFTFPFFLHSSSSPFRSLPPLLRVLRSRICKKSDAKAWLVTAAPLVQLYTCVRETIITQHCCTTAYFFVGNSWGGETFMHHVLVCCFQEAHVRTIYLFANVVPLLVV